MQRAGPGHTVGQGQSKDSIPRLMAPKPSLILKAAAVSEELFPERLHPSYANTPPPALPLWPSVAASVR